MDTKREDIDYMYDNISKYIEKYGVASLLEIIIDILKVKEVINVSSSNSL